MLERSNQPKEAIVSDHLHQLVRPDMRLAEVYSIAFGYLSSGLEAFLTGHRTKEEIAETFLETMEFVRDETERRIATQEADQQRAHAEYLTFLRQTEKEQVTGEKRKAVRLGGALYDRTHVTKS